MQLIDGAPVYSATDLVGFLACSHRFALERAALAGMVKKPIRKDPAIEPSGSISTTLRPLAMSSSR